MTNPAPSTHTSMHGSPSGHGKQDGETTLGGNSFTYEYEVMATSLNNQLTNIFELNEWYRVKGLAWLTSFVELIQYKYKPESLRKLFPLPEEEPKRLKCSRGHFLLRRLHKDSADAEREPQLSADELAEFAKNFPQCRGQEAVPMETDCQTTPPAPSPGIKRSASPAAGSPIGSTSTSQSKRLKGTPIHVSSTARGVLILGKPPIQEQIPEGIMRVPVNAGALAEFNEYVTKTEVEDSERHACFCGLLHLLIGETPEEANASRTGQQEGHPSSSQPTICNGENETISSFSVELIERVVKDNVNGWKDGKSLNERNVKSYRKEIDRKSEEIKHMTKRNSDSDEQFRFAIERCMKANKVLQTLYQDEPPKTVMLAGQSSSNQSGKEAIENLSASAHPQVMALGSKDNICALVFVCDVEIDFDAPDDLLQSLSVAYEVPVTYAPPRAPPPVVRMLTSSLASPMQVRDKENKDFVISEVGAQIEIPLHRKDGVYDALLVHDGKDRLGDKAEFGSQLNYKVVSHSEWAQSPCKARCAVVFTSEDLTSEMVDELKCRPDWGHVPCLKHSASNIDRNEVLNFILLCSIVPSPYTTKNKKNFIEDEPMINFVQSVLHRVKIDVQRSRLPIRKDSLSCEHGMHISSLIIVAYATYEPPDEEALVPMDAEEVKPPSLEQARVAEALLRRTKRMLGESAFNTFKEVQFLICVPAFTTLHAQTAYRVRKAGLLDRERNEDEYSKVVMNTAGATGDQIFTAFKLRAQREPETLFIIIADVSARHTFATPAAHPRYLLSPHI